MDNQDNSGNGSSMPAQGTEPVQDTPVTSEEKCTTCGNSASTGNCVPCGQNQMSCTCTPQSGVEPTTPEQPTTEPEMGSGGGMPTA